MVRRAEKHVAARACALAADAVGGADEHLTGTVRLTASEMVGIEVLPGLLAPLARQHPQIQIALVPGDTPSHLLDREADIAVRMLVWASAW